MSKSQLINNCVTRVFAFRVGDIYSERRQNYRRSGNVILEISDERAVYTINNRVCNKTINQQK